MGPGSQGFAAYTYWDTPFPAVRLVVMKYTRPMPPPVARWPCIHLKSYNFYLVALSLVVAIFVSTTALSLFARVSSHSSRSQRALWILGGGVAMGCGIWATHFLGMLALRIPIPLTYDLEKTVTS